MKRRTLLKATAAAAAAPLLGCQTRGAAPAKRPNVLFLFTDDQRFDTIRALGNPEIETPNLDRLAARGVAFTHAHIMGGTGGAICIASRAMLLTGRTLFRAPNDLGAFATWPETFRQAGYETFGTGKWHNGAASYARSFSAGEAIFFGGMNDHRKVPVYDFAPDGKYPKSRQHVAEEFSSELFSNAAIRFLGGYRGAAPFFAYVAYTAPHDPRTPPKEWADRYDPQKITLPKNFMPEHPFDNGELKVRDEQLAPWPRTPEVIRRHIADYYGMISHVDEQIGRVLGALDETGHARDTIIVFGGDNGLAVGRHGLLGKQNLYEHSVRVPLIISAPGVGKPGTRCDALVYLHDIFPTVCDLAGVAAPETIESKDLVPLMRDPSARAYDDLYAAYRDLQRMVRTERWKLIVYPKVRVTQLFDVQADPWELRNLADAPEHAATLADMRGRLARWQGQVGDKVST